MPIQDISIDTQGVFPYAYPIKKQVLLKNCLQTIAPELASQWHPTKNGELTPRDVTKGSMKKVWWKCAEDHVWQATVNSRYHGTGCKRCRWK